MFVIVSHRVIVGLLQEKLWKCSGSTAVNYSQGLSGGGGSSNSYMI